MKANSLLHLVLILMITGCAMMPRDEVEPYEAAIEDYEYGYYNLALSRFEDAVKLDSLYYPLAAAMAHAHYELGYVDSSSVWLERAARLSTEYSPEYLAYQAERNLESSSTETLGFLDYVTSVARRYGIDPGLLLAVMQQESSLQADAISPSGAVGMMQLMPATGKALGMSVPQENYVKKPPIRDHEADERFHPGKNIAGGASHLNFLLNHYRFDKRNTNLCKALGAYLAGTGNVRDTIPSYCNHYINRISEFYRQNRYQFEHHRELEDQYYRLNPDAPGFSRESGSVSFSKKKMRRGYDRIRRDVDMVDERDRAIYYGNLALMAESLGIADTAMSYYDTALTIFSDEQRIRYNRAVLRFKQGQYTAAIGDLDQVETFPARVLTISAWISLGDLDVAQGLIDELFRSNPTSIELIELSGIVALLRDEVELSIWYFSQAVAKRGSQIDINHLLVSKYAWYYGNRIEVDYGPVRHTGFLGDSWLEWPVSERYISSYYGWRPNAVERDWKKRLEKMEFHSGIDIPAATGEPVRAAADGVVWISTTYDMSGESVYIQHENGWFTSYYHMDKRLVEKGDHLKKGDVIGMVGSTGRSTGAHLHFGLFDRNWKPVNPLLYLTGY